MTYRPPQKHLFSVALEQIKSLITSDGISPGARLPGERELGKRLGISRSSVREALRALEVMGFVDIRSRSGTYVANPAEEGLHVSLRQSLINSRAGSVRQIFELRELIEPGIAALAAQRAVASDLAALRQSLVEMETCIERENLVGTILADAWFHHTITKAAGNAYLTELMDDVVYSLEESRKVSLLIPDQGKRALSGHRHIYDAIEVRDASAAASAMQQHLSDAWSYISKIVESSKSKSE